MTTRAERWMILLELTRLSNAPTVVTNLLVGIAVSLWGVGPIWRQSSDQLMSAVAACFGVLMLYAAGMAFNDVADATVDRVDAPTRPIPSGRITRRAAAGVAAVLGAGGLICLALAGALPLLIGGALACFIVGYDLLHKRHAAAVVLMGLCRSCVYLIGAATIETPSQSAWLVAAVMGAYTTFLTLLARGERAGGSPLRNASWALCATPLLLIFAAAPSPPTALDIAPAVAGAAWLGLAARRLTSPQGATIAGILGLLSGFAFLDAIVLLRLEAPALAFVAAFCFVLTASLHRRIPGT